jgi:hypothetical protein
MSNELLIERMFELFDEVSGIADELHEFAFAIGTAAGEGAIIAERLHPEAYLRYLDKVSKQLKLINGGCESPMKPLNKRRKKPSTKKRR